MKVLTTCQNLLEQGYEDKVRRMLNKYDLHEVKVDPEAVEAVAVKARERIEKAKKVLSKPAEAAVVKEEQEVSLRIKRAAASIQSTSVIKHRCDRPLHGFCDKLASLSEDITLRHYRFFICNVYSLFSPRSAGERT